MLKAIFLVASFSVLAIAYGQESHKGKAIIDTSILGKWPFLFAKAKASGDGKYFYYLLENNPVPGEHSFIITSLTGSWRYTVVDVDDAQFVDNSRRVICQRGDVLYDIKLGTNVVDSIRGVESYKLNCANESKWIAYKLIDRSLIVKNFDTDEKVILAGVTQFAFSKCGNTLVFVSDAHGHDDLSMMDLNHRNDQKSIWTPDSSLGKSLISEIRFDETGSFIAFIVDCENNFTPKKEIYVYDVHTERPRKIADDYESLSDFKLPIFSLIGFSKNGKYLFFNLRAQPRKVDTGQVKIWRYQDSVLLPEQIRRSTMPNFYLAGVDLTTMKIIRYQYDDERLETLPADAPGDFIVVSSHYGQDIWWDGNPTLHFIVSLRNGTRRCLEADTGRKYKGIYKLSNFSFSPKGRFLAYFDNENSNYFQYNLLNNAVKNVTGFLGIHLMSVEEPNVVGNLAIDKVIYWNENDSFFLLYDRFDIWKIYTELQHRAENLTRGFGRGHKLSLRFAEDISQYRTLKGKILLSAFDSISKYNGFCTLDLSRSKDPKVLTLGPYTYCIIPSQIPNNQGANISNGNLPIKVGNNGTWLVLRQSASEPPNWYLTKDFSKFHRLTDIEPQLNYEWMSTKLISWRMLDSQFCQGILYLPENFDPQKRYPILFNYYEQRSHELYQFIYPDYCTGEINIPWFVTRGYLVFVPDIHFTPANISGKAAGEWAYNSLVSAVGYLKKMPYVDSSKMGLEGHSFGGLETVYLVTHTTCFSAAVEAAGVTDPISAYLTLVPFLETTEHFSPQIGTEVAHDMYSCTPWDKPDLYLRNSAVLSVKGMKTPLLIMHNELDNQIPWRQGIELYMAMRRLHEKVWLIQYANGTHTVEGRDAADFTLRMTQFFDYFLRGFSAPLWLYNSKE